MLFAQQPILRRFWYALMPTAHLDDGPKPFTLLGEPLVLFKGVDGKPIALQDRCCHRTAKLSKGFVENGNIVCGYHGWTYDATGSCVRIPQNPEGNIPAGAKVKSYHCDDQYGYVWVALEDPLQPIPPFPEDGPGYRRIFQFYETWKTSPLRFMENSFDAAHFSFVHKATFGMIDKPRPVIYDLIPTPTGFRTEGLVPVANTMPGADRITDSKEAVTNRNLSNEWFLPAVRKFGCVYPDSGIHHIIYNCATPIDDEHIQLVQWLYRNDSEEQCSTEELIAWDTLITIEDRDILEATDPDACVDTRRRVEFHMESDRPGLMMRKMLHELLKAHGEEEVYRQAPEPRLKLASRPAA
ncbi:MAG: aromatic ring-hydroxylating dioxygenase subunit alpha [Candidatus Protistobacter heckmanni]|nr:aromatic ring-hydroxylating dioxygenase subunit alpha [Candidatus Protistobacter heckmanni]